MDKLDQVCRRTLLAVAALVGVYVTAFSYLSFLMYISFAYRDWDLAIYANFFHNALRGCFTSSLLGAPFFGNHLNLLLVPLLPIYLLWQNPYTLLLLQAIALGLAAFPLYAIARKEVGPGAAVVCAFLYLIHPAVHYTNLNEFHPETFFPLLFFSAFYFMTDGRTRWLLVFAALCLLLKENMALVIAPLGLYAAFVHRNRAGWLIFAASVAWFIASVLFIIPPLNQGVIGYYNIYPEFGNTPAAILKQAFLHPLQVLAVLCRPGKIVYVAHLLGPLCFLPLLGPGVAAMAVPILGQHLLSSRATEYTLAYYYSIEVLPPFFVGTVYGLKFLSRFVVSPALRRTGMAFIAAVGIVATALTGPFSETATNQWNFNMDYLDLEKARLVERVPPEVPVMATFEFLTRLSARKELYSFDYVYTGYSILSSIPYKLPDSVEYALVDFNDLTTFRVFYTPGGHENIRRALARQHLEPLDFVESMVLFGRQKATGPRLLEILDRVPAAEIGNVIGACVSDDIELIGFTVQNTDRKDLLDLVFFWGCLRPTSRDFTLCLDVVTRGGTTLEHKYHPIGYRIRPTNSWSPGEVLKERARFVVPSPESQLPWELRACFFDEVTRQQCRISGVAELDSLGRMTILVRDTNRGPVPPPP